MSVTILFLALIASIVGWFLAHQRLTAKPWLEVGVIGDVRDTVPPPAFVAKVGLGVLLAVIGCLFALLSSAYLMRAGLADWKLLPVPRILWLNTVLLVLSSAALQWALIGARRGLMEDVRAGLFAGGLCALAFVAGQLLAWRELNAAGYFLASNPANAFFYLLTGVHALHILGGLVALGRTINKVLVGVAMSALRSSIELCAIYWHFLLLVWLVLLGLLTGWTDNFVDICRQLLS